MRNYSSATHERVARVFNDFIIGEFQNMDASDFYNFGESGAAQLSTQDRDAPRQEFDSDDSYAAWLMESFDPDRIYRESE